MSTTEISRDTIVAVAALSVRPTTQRQHQTSIKLSKCKFCNCLGHTITTCESSLIQLAIVQITNAANYSIAYQPGPMFFSQYLNNLLCKTRIVLTMRMGLGSRGSKKTLFEALYTVPMAGPNAVELAKAAIDESTVEGRRGLRIIDSSLNGSYHAHIHFNDNHRSEFDQIFPNYVAPSCPREEALYLAKKFEIEQHRRQFALDRATRALNAARAETRRLRMELTAADAVWRLARDTYIAADNAIYALNHPVVVRKFDITITMANTIPIADGQAPIAPAVDCPICYEAIENANIIRTNCGHDFCQTCLTKCLSMVQQDQNKQPCCAMCRAQTVALTFKNPAICQVIMEQFCE